MGIDGIKKAQTTENVTPTTSVTETNATTSEPIKSNEQPLPDLYDESYSFESSKEDKAIHRFLAIFKNDNLICDEILLEELSKLKAEGINIAEFLENYPFWNHYHTNNSQGLIKQIESNPNIKNSTKEKCRKFFTEELEKSCNFDKKMKRENIQTNFTFENFEYHSDIYDVIQKDENTLLIVNHSKKEERVIDLKRLIPSERNELNHIIELKAAIQKLPPDILWQIPDEVSLIQHRTADLDYSYAAGIFGRQKDGKEIVIATGNKTVLTHELAHAIFFDKKGKETLSKNSDVVKSFKTAIKNIKADGLTPYNENPEPNNLNLYWTDNLSEYGAEIITMIYSEDDYRAKKTLQKYSPEGVELVFKHFQERTKAKNRHNHYTL